MTTPATSTAQALLAVREAQAAANLGLYLEAALLALQACHLLGDAEGLDRKVRNLITRRVMRYMDREVAVMDATRDEDDGDHEGGAAVPEPDEAPEAPPEVPGLTADPYW